MRISFDCEISKDFLGISKKDQEKNPKFNIFTVTNYPA